MVTVAKDIPNWQQQAEHASAARLLSGAFGPK
jgi:hypothetical protein